MKEDVGTSKLKKHANKVGRLTQGPKLNKSLPYNPTYNVSTYTAIKQNTKNLYSCRVIWKWFVYAYDSNATSTSEDTNAHAQLNSTWLD